MDELNENEYRESFDIAIVGMAGRFPGARNLEEFWRNLRDGVESITLFSDEHLQSLGVDPKFLHSPNFVKAGALIDDVEMFDASFFGYSPKEAEIIDPQHRVFLECAWEALENAGYNEAYEGLVGVFAGTSLSTYLLYNLLAQSVDPEDGFQTMIGNDKDFLSTRVSYELNLKGPSLDIQTACSTSLVAVHVALQSLLNYQCDMALVGGISIQVPQRTGYFYQEGGISSPDGHCRPFDAEGQGTIFGSGVGIVVLKRLDDAINDRDTIHAVIKGSAINNDGSAKISYTAPSIEGQSQVIASAQFVAGVEADTISYVEAHGTATPLGDPVEIAALTKAFRASTDKRQFCAVGSVKSNVGHLDAAAGVASLIKTVLALKHRQLPPSLHYKTPNPKCEFGESPFYVNAELREWRPLQGVRRAGVSSFGVGGTNAHLIVEEAPLIKAVASESEAAAETTEDATEHATEDATELLLLTAKSAEALEAASARLAEHLQAGEGARQRLEDIAYTLQVGRQHFSHRRAVVCRSLSQAVENLINNDARYVQTSQYEGGQRSVVFMFPGGGTQYVQMGLDLYRTEQVFREQVDLCAGILQKQIGYDIRESLYPSADRLEEMAGRFKQTSVALPALFVVEYALAKLWMAWGVYPEAMIGHSLGEYVAACLAGVFSLEDALALVVLRGKLFEQLPEGAMLGVSLPADEVQGLLNEQLSIAAINGPSQCVVSGGIDAIDEMAELLAEKEIEFRRIQIDVAAHSWMVAPLLEEFTAFLKKLKLKAPQIPYLSNVTGTWITGAEATSPHYWARHLRQTVRFADGIRELSNDPARIYLEVGPGQTLSTLASLQENEGQFVNVVSSIRHPYDQQHDAVYLQRAVGKLWGAGASIDWAAMHQPTRPRRVALPTYPFQRQRYWVEADARPRAMAGYGHHIAVDAGRAGADARGELDSWFYLPSWKRTLAPRAQGSGESLSQAKQWIIFTDGGGLGEALAERLGAAQQSVAVVEMGERFEQVTAERYRVRATEREDYERLLSEFETTAAEAGSGIAVVHLWSLPEAYGARSEEREREAAGDGGISEWEKFERAQACGYYSLLALAQASAAQSSALPLNISVVTNYMQQIESTDRCVPEQATVLAACKVIPQEQEQVTCRSIDVALGASEKGRARVVEQLLSEVSGSGEEPAVAYRGAQRWAQAYEQVRLAAEGDGRGLRRGGVYLITGGLGGVGLLLAEYLCREWEAKLALVSRSGLPPRERWAETLQQNDGDNRVEDDRRNESERERRERRQIEWVKRLEEQGAEVEVLAADVSDEAQLRRVVEFTETRFGALHGVIHAAGIQGEQAVGLIPTVNRESSELQFQPKVKGLYVLARTLKERELDFCLLFSSNAAILGGLGSYTYAAANVFMDAFAASRLRDGGTPWISANWDGWLLQDTSQLNASFQTSMDQYAMMPQESVEAFRRVVSASGISQMVVSTGDLSTRLRMWLAPQTSAGKEGTENGPAPALHPRPALSTTYAPPVSDIEHTVVKVWQDLLGIEQLGINDNFFDLGGNSLIGLKVIGRLKKELGINIPIVTLFEGPTVSALAKAIGENDNQPTYEESRSRGDRRRERRRHKHLVAESE
jgi:acyl transferase domain-containing protein/acyl carrier protein